MDSNKVKLRALEPEDWEVLYKWENDTKNWMLSQTSAPYSKYILQKFIESSNNNLFADKQLRLMVEEVQTSKTIGVLDFFDYDSENRRAGIGILIGDEYRRRGFGLATLQAAIQFAFEIEKVHQIYCDVMASNQESLRLFQRAGFSVVGVKKDWLISNCGFEDVYILQCINPKF